MKNSVIFKSTTLFLVFTLFASVLITTSCGKDDNDDDDMQTKESPEIPPPEESFEINFSHLDTGENSAYASLAKGEKNYSYASFWHSAFIVWAWDFILTVNLAIPVASFKVAVAQQAEQVSDDPYKWKWAFDFWNGQYTAELFATLQNSEIKWEMFINHQNFEEPFLWYEGKSNIGSTSGTWTLYKTYQNPVNFIDIEWERTPAEETWEIKYTHSEEGANNYGGYVVYGVTNEADYDLYYSVSNAAEGRLTEIQMNNELKYGRVKDNIRFNDEAWHCWSEEYYDIDCDSIP